VTKTAEEAKVALEAASAAYLSALERDCERSEGSGAQERRNDERLERLRDAKYAAKRELEAVEREQQKNGGGNTTG
jgi:hypothetical protein